jgi:hypothetical protein
MIEISQPGDRKFFVLRSHGAQPKLDIIAIAGELWHIQKGDAALRVLFDWSKLKSWPFEAPSLATIQKWKETVPFISRAAIVHDQKWNRHAALLAALLRVGNAQVRSFRASDYNGAIVWLEQSRSNARLR